MSARKAKAAIPKLTRQKEAARRMIRALANDLTHGLKSTAKRRARAGGTKGKEFRPNPWKKCPECFHRVPKMCPQCGNGRANVVPTHTQACCPGVCIKCKRCRNPAAGCPGWCTGGCQKCKDRCPGECRNCGSCGCSGKCQSRENSS